MKTHKVYIPKSKIFIHTIQRSNIASRCYNQDVFINVVGGVRITETAIDLALLSAVLSSIRNQPLEQNLVVFGEVGLGGEIRPVQSGQERIKAAITHGFKKAIIPKANAPKKPLKEIEIIAVKNLAEALQAIRQN